RFVPLKIKPKTDPHAILKQVDLIIPAIENDPVLAILEKWSVGIGIPLAFDREAYAVSSSKMKSNVVFRDLGLSTPDPWPQCGFPMVVKPDGESGSEGVQVIHNQEELVLKFPAEEALDRMVAQAYLEGPLYSIEVMGSPGQYATFQVTELHMDSTHDCKRVLAPSGLDPVRVLEFRRMATAIAEHIQLRGLMDVEVVLHEGQLKVLEIDARVPSQTPTAVFHATGINMVELLGELFLTGKMTVNHAEPARTTLYQHIKVAGGHIEVMGEHIMSGASPLKRYQGLFGADEVITNYHPGREEWVATLIFKGKTMEDVLVKKRQTHENTGDKAGRNAW
ncbi:MAG: 3-methylornithine--L-lysine ligase PylC, partial [Planctomycetes bacterium]|nr:3-methylornithine--L-lysine ligase PylC [Planctomycetota bacterium]